MKTVMWRGPRAREMGTMMGHFESVMFMCTNIFIKLKVGSRNQCFSNGSVEYSLMDLFR